jgi:hypothetical protein
MHFLLYVCLPTEEAKTSLQARRKVAGYLSEQHFCGERRFCGVGDYFSVGGRHSGMLELLRLRQQQPVVFDRFLKRYYGKMLTKAAAISLFKKTFSPAKGNLPPICRDDDFLGQEDDAQIMDRVLFRALKAGFGEYVKYRFAFEKPCVIFTALDEDDWCDASNVIGKQWVVPIDFHD